MPPLLETLLLSNLIKAVSFTNYPWLVNRCIHGCRKDFFLGGN